MKKSLPFRAWYYFRTGYSTYLTFIIASVNLMVTVYYLAIRNIPQLETVFPEFSSWALTVASVGIPAAIIIGWLHIKRSPAYRSEVDVQIEANPYYYKLPPGFWKEAVAPFMLETIRLNMKLLNKEQLSEAELNSIKELQKKFETLIDGGYVGNPKRMPN